MHANGDENKDSDMAWMLLIFGFFPCDPPEVGPSDNSRIWIFYTSILRDDFIFYWDRYPNRRLETLERWMEVR